MKSKKTSPIWPYLSILACLFVLCVTAPRAWDRMARHETLSHAPSGRTSRVAQVPIAPRAENLEEADQAELTLRETLTVPTPPILESRAVEIPIVEPPALEPTRVQAAVPPAPEIPAEIPQDAAVAHRPASPPDNADLETPSEISSTQGEDPPVPEVGAWPLPRALVEQLIRLKQETGAPWAQQAVDLIHQMCRTGVQNDRGDSNILKELRRLSEQDAVSANIDARQESRMARARYALTRWLDIWEDAAALQEISPSEVVNSAEPERMGTCLADVDSLMRQGSSGGAWRTFLQLESLGALARPGRDDTDRRAAARKVLDRMTSSRLSPRQRKFVNDGPMAKLQAELRLWAAEPVTTARLLSDLEQYEHTGLASDARLVANDYRGLIWSAPAEAEKIGHSLDTHYRNANFRVAITGPLANRLLPQPAKVSAPVQDTIVSVPVYGQSTTSTKLSVRLVPDPQRIRVGLEARGLIDSDTVGSSGPATFYNEGRSTFTVQKLLVLGPRGLSVWPAVAEANNDYSYLVSLETDYDGVPLVGPLVRSIARNQMNESRGQARMEVEHKVAKRAREQLDAEVRPLLVKAVARVEKQELATLKRLGLDLEPLGLSTTEERIVARARLAGPEQLGAHTPRPRAPADSWFSMQLHQSALNNALEQLDLDGRSFALAELFKWIAEKLDRPTLAVLDDLPDNVHLTFAKRDAVRLQCEDGRVEVTFAFAELTQGRRSWRDFTVRTRYLPEAQELSPCFVRDRMLSFAGRSVQGKAQVLLRTIFSKVLSPNRDLRLLSEKITSDPRIQDLQISQFVVEDGWIGLAYSPRRAAANVARRPTNATTQ